MNTTIPPKDFPLWFPPALVKELRKCLKSSGFVYSLILIPCFLIFLFLLNWENMEALTAFTWISLVACMAILIPCWALASMHADMDGKNSDFLSLTNLTPWRNVLGKWIAYQGIAVIHLFTFLPFFVIRYFGGGLDLINELAILGILYLYSGIITAAAIWASGMSSLMRIIFPLALIATAAILVGIVLSVVWEELNFMNRIYFEFSTFIFGVVSVLVYSSLAVVFFLSLATRWLSPPSTNTVVLFRLIPFMGLIIPLVQALLELTPLNISSDLFLYHALLIGVISLSVIVIEIILPNKLLPIHIVRMVQKGRKKWIFLPFLPGFPSAALYSLILLLVLMLISAFALKMPFSQIAVFTLCAAIAAWYSLLLPALVFYPIPKKDGIATLVMYYVLMISILPPLGLVFMLVPMLGAFFPGLGCVALIFKAFDSWLHTVLNVGIFLGIGPDHDSVSIMNLPWSVIPFIIFGYVIIVAIGIGLLCRPWFKSLKEGFRLSASMLAPTNVHPTKEASPQTHE